MDPFFESGKVKCDEKGGKVSVFNMLTVMPIRDTFQFISLRSNSVLAVTLLQLVMSSVKNKPTKIENLT